MKKATPLCASISCVAFCLPLTRRSVRFSGIRLVSFLFENKQKNIEMLISCSFGFSGTIKDDHRFLGYWSVQILAGSVLAYVSANESGDVTSSIITASRSSIHLNGLVICSLEIGQSSTPLIPRRLWRHLLSLANQRTWTNCHRFVTKGTHLCDNEAAKRFAIWSVWRLNHNSYTTTRRDFSSDASDIDTTFFTFHLSRWHQLVADIRSKLGRAGVLILITRDRLSRPVCRTCSK